MSYSNGVPKKRGRPKVNKQHKDTHEDKFDHDRFKYELIGPKIASVGDKTFYSSFIVNDIRISVGDCVDVLIRIRKNGNRDTKLGKIAAIFEQNINFKKLFVEIAYFFDENEGVVKKSNYTYTNWAGFSHKNEVVASNKFEYVEADTIDELINVHSDFESYKASVQDYDDEEINVFCKYICYIENYAIVPFEPDKEWEWIMLKYSKHYHLYVNRDKQGKSLLGRENEMKKLKIFLEVNIRQEGTGQILYVTGVPGTGKTTTVSLAIEEMVSRSKLGIIPDFDVVDINATQFHNAKDIYNAIYTKMFSIPATNHHQSLKLLEEEFSKDRTKPCVLIIDEVDYLLTRSQSVLFTLFNWPSYPGSKVILIIISNTIDLPNRLKNSCNSRLSFGTLIFTPYTGQQVNNVLESISDEDSESISLCAKRVANYCGDMRKAFHIYRKAGELGKGQLTVSNVNKASNAILQSLVNKIENLEWCFKCVLTCLVNSGEDMASIRYLHRKFVGITSVAYPDINLMDFEPHHFKLLLLKMVSLGLIKLVPAIFETNNCEDETSTKIEPDNFMDDTGIILIPPISQIITALSKDAIWGLKISVH